MSTAFGRMAARHVLRYGLIALVASIVPTLAFAQTGTVTGTVTNSATSAPVQSTVVFCSQSSGGTSCMSTGTNASGMYTLNLQAGVYFAYTANSGLVNEIYDNVPCPGSACQPADAVASGTPIVVVAGATTSGRNFALDPGGSISGVVTDEDTGAPVQSVSVSIYTRLGQTSAFVGSSTTNAAGVYSVGGLTTGTYYALTTNSVGYTNEIYNNILCAFTCSSQVTTQSGHPIAVVTGETTPNVNFALELGGTITGTVVNAATSAPLQGVVVQVYSRFNASTGADLNFVTSVITNASGVYTVRGLPTGTYYLATQAGSNLNVQNELYNNLPCVGACVVSLSNPGTPVPVVAGTTASGINFQLEPGGTVSGTITDSATALPLQNVLVTAYRQVGSNVSAVASATTNASGAYTLGGLPTGTYFIVTSSATHLDEVFDNIPCGVSCPTSAILSGAPTSVVAGANTPGRDFALDPGGSISGTVINTATGAPLANVNVSVHARSGATGVFAGSANTNSSGVWTVTGLPTGTYVALTNASTNLRLTNEIYSEIPCPTTCSSTTAVSAGTPIAVTAGAVTPGIAFTLSPSTSPPSAPTNFGAVVQGGVARFSWTAPGAGAPATSYIIEAGLTPGSTIVTLPATSTSIDIPVPPGEFYVRVRAVNAFGTSPPSNEYRLIVNADGSSPLNAPTNFSARMNGSRLTVTWADPQFGGVPGSYILEVGFATGQTALTLPLTQRSLTFDPVPNGVYFLRVRARNGAQVSPPSAEAMIVVGGLPSPPEGPRNLTHSVSGSTLTLTWSAPFAGTPTSYIVEAGFESGAASISIDTGSSATSATFTNVPPGTYYVRVRARNAQGVSLPSNERVVVVN